jgi:CRP-like cAMP-binding protein
LNSGTRNQIILSTRPQAQDFLLSHSQIRPLTAGQTIYRAGEDVTHAILPHDGIISLLAQPGAGRTVEKASIGMEGFVGFTHLMGGKSALGDVVVSVDGNATWLALAELQAAMDQFACVRSAMLAYARCLIVQLLESVACNSLHTAEQRVTRWLLMAHDRMAAPEFTLTQESLASLLGLRRATVSRICSDLAARGAITYSRGRLAIVDRTALEASGCDCYHRTSLARIEGLNLPH